MIISTSQENYELYFSAETTYHQFLAVAIYFRQYNFIDEISKLPYLTKIKGTKNLDLNLIKKWLVNGWNTEKILITNKQLLLNDDNYFVLQWSFPQAYYSVFATTLAYFSSVGYTENSHTAVLKKLGEIIHSGEYPSFLSFNASGTKKNMNYHNIDCHSTNKTWGVSSFDTDSVENKICQFLRTTRKIQLDEKREDMKKNFLTSKHQPKKKIDESEWEKVSQKTGYTTIFNFIYRKRIKANYRDIDTFNYEGIKSSQINNCLLRIVSAINLTNESFVYKAIGLDNYNKIFQGFYKGVNDSFLEKRFGLINNNI